MVAPPTWSIVIPVHGGRDLLLACLDSLPDRPYVEVLVVDDGSQDGTADAVHGRHPRVNLLRNEEAAGFTRSANRGLDAARGRFLLLLNSDTELHPGSLEAAEAAFADPGLGIAGAALHYPGGRPQWSGGPAPTLAWLFGLASGLPGQLRRLPGAGLLRPVAGSGGGAVDWVTGAALALRRQTWEEVGPMDPAFSFYAQDLDLCTRAREAGWGVAVAPDFRVLHHHGATIGTKRGAVGRQNPVMLWGDLLRWARKARGPEWARRASLVLRAGTRLRLACRRVGDWAVRDADARAARRQESREYRRALETLERSAGGGDRL